MAKQLDAFSGLGQAFVLGGMMMAKHAGADHGSFQRSIFRHAAAQKQGFGIPERNLAAIKDRRPGTGQQTNIAACYQYKLLEIIRYFSGAEASKDAKAATIR